MTPGGDLKVLTSRPHPGPHPRSWGLDPGIKVPMKRLIQGPPQTHCTQSTCPGCTRSPRASESQRQPCRCKAEQGQKGQGSTSQSPAPAQASPTLDSPWPSSWPQAGQDVALRGPLENSTAAWRPRGPLGFTMGIDAQEAERGLAGGPLLPGLQVPRLWRDSRGAAIECPSIAVRLTAGGHSCRVLAEECAPSFPGVVGL